MASPVLPFVSNLTNVCVFGSGAFGTALATVLARQPSKPLVHVWHMFDDESAMINKKRENVFFLKGPPLAENIVFTSSVASAIQGAQLILLVIPTQFMRSFLIKHREYLMVWLQRYANVPVLVCNKGIEVGTLMFPCDILADVMPFLAKPTNGTSNPAIATAPSGKDVASPLLLVTPTAAPARAPGAEALFSTRIAVLAGPSFAAEIATFRFTACAVASKDIRLARVVQHMMSCRDGSFRLYATTDVVGCEVASAVKNVLAIASGAASGSGQKLNCRAAIICRGLAEMTNLVDRLDGSGLALPGLAGVGDLLLTCSSENSRNFTVGVRLGKGETLADIMKHSRAVAEGVATSKALKELCAKLGLKMPVCDEVYKVLYEQRTVKDCFETLVHGPLEDEINVLARRNRSAGSRGQDAAASVHPPSKL